MFALVTISSCMFVNCDSCFSNSALRATTEASSMFSATTRLYSASQFERRRTM